MQSEYFRIVNRWDIINVLPVFDDLVVGVTWNLIFISFLCGGSRAFRNDLDEAVFISEYAFFYVVVSIGDEKLTIKIVSNFASVLNFAGHIFDDIAVYIKCLHVVRRALHQESEVLLHVSQGRF
jgi:hypothetical protein